MTQTLYISNTQQKRKARMTQHFNKTKEAENKGLPTYSFAKHFAKQNKHHGQNLVAK